MHKRIVFLWILFGLSCGLSGCGNVGEKSESLVLVYGIIAALSLIVLLAYCIVEKKKRIWFLLLFSSVLIVNTGYFCLAASRSLAAALMANRIAYLGSVFLPLAMLMIILDVIQANNRKWLPVLFVILSVFVFLVAASPGYLDIYYKEVSFRVVNGVGSLQKVYGSWHGLYLIYLLGYFTAMVSAIIYAAINNKVSSMTYAIVLAAAVFVNIGVWLIEQFVNIEFEILSVSYIISELFLLGLHFLMAEQEKLNRPAAPLPAQIPVQEPTPISVCDAEAFQCFQNGITDLTHTERLIFDAYVAGKTTKEIMTELNIKENTLKFHNKNIYSKLGVSSRKQLLTIYRNLSEKS